MQSIPTPSHYDSRTIVLHWLTAALVISLWSLGQTIDWFPKGDPRIYARSTHISLGAMLAIVLVIRISWRVSKGTHLPPAGLGWLDKLSTLTHWLLYTLLVLTVSLGIANAWIRGDAIFHFFKIPVFPGATDGMRETVEDWHGYAANTLLVLAFFHAAAALMHHFYWKDGVLRRMLPAR